jgi:hypothetical protein
MARTDAGSSRRSSTSSADRSVRTAVTSRHGPRRRHHHKSTVSSRTLRAASSQTPAEAPTLPPTPRIALASKENDMIVLGLVLLVVGFLLHISILTTLGIILLVIGAVLAILGGTGRMVGGRRHWY